MQSKETGDKLLKLFISHPTTLADFIDDELKDLGIFKKIPQGKGTLIETSWIKAMQFGLNSRYASGLYLKLEELEVQNEQELYEKMCKVSWSNYLNPQTNFKVKTNFSRIDNKDLFKNSHFISLKVKDAICDFFMKKVNKRPSVDKLNAQVSFYMHIEEKKHNFKASLYFDLIGEPLFNRGYRPKEAIAPLKENVAAGLISTMNKSRMHNKRLIDFMCGSGTLLIEAFLLQENIPPSYLKVNHFFSNKKNIWALQNTPFYKKNIELKNMFIDCLKDVQKQTDLAFSKMKTSQNEYFGSDISKQAIDHFHISLKKSRLISFIGYQRKNALKVNPRSEEDTIISNLPYGTRIGRNDDLEKLYFDIGEHLKNNFKNNQAFLFTGNPDLRKHIRLKPKKKTPFMNGPIDCRLIQYDLY